MKKILDNLHVTSKGYRVPIPGKLGEIEERVDSTSDHSCGVLHRIEMRLGVGIVSKQDTPEELEELTKQARKAIQRALYGEVLYKYYELFPLLQNLKLVSRGDLWNEIQEIEDKISEIGKILDE